jgi:D-cysteine desulfhydrase
MPPPRAGAIGRRAFVVGAGVAIGCSRKSADVTPPTEPVVAPPPAALESATLPPPPLTPPSPTFALFDAFPALAAAVPRVVLARFPSAVAPATRLVGGATVHVKRDDDFTLAAAYDASDPACRGAGLFGGGKLRKLELFFGDARARGARTVVTFGGVGSNQALATALFGRALGFGVRLYLAPQPPSSLTADNLGADAATDAEMRLFPSVVEAQAAAARDLARDAALYAIAPGGTTPLGTLGFVSAGLEIAEDVRAGRLPAPRRIYVALGLGGTAVGLGLGCAAAGLRTEVVAVRASNPATVSASTLRALHDETVAFARARDASFPAVAFHDANVRIDGRFVGRGYGFPTAAGDDAVARAKTTESWALDPVYTGKAVAALLADAASNAGEPVLFWNTASSRPVARAAVPALFRRFVG